VDDICRFHWRVDLADRLSLWVKQGARSGLLQSYEHFMGDEVYHPLAGPLGEAFHCEASRFFLLCFLPYKNIFSVLINQDWRVRFYTKVSR